MKRKIRVWIGDKELIFSSEGDLDKIKDEFYLKLKLSLNKNEPLLIANHIMNPSRIDYIHIE